MPDAILAAVQWVTGFFDRENPVVGQPPDENRGAKSEKIATTSLLGQVSARKNLRFSLLDGVYGLFFEVAVLFGDVATLFGDAVRLFGDVAALFGNTAMLFEDVAALFGNIATLFGDVATLFGDVFALFGDVAILLVDFSTPKKVVSAWKSSTYARLQGASGGTVKKAVLQPLFTLFILFLPTQTRFRHS